jgi:hypothetical protein
MSSGFVRGTKAAVNTPHSKRFAKVEALWQVAPAFGLRRLQRRSCLKVKGNEQFRDNASPFPCPLAFPPGSAENSRVMPPPRRIPPRQRVLAQWRGVDVAPIEAAQAVRARRVGDVLPRVTKDLHMDQRRAEAEIIKVWNSMIDPTIVAHAQPAGVRKGTLFVNVDSSVWLSEIVRYRRKEILDRLQYSFGRDLIQRISFRVG